MARMQFTGNGRVKLLTTVANKAAPTVAEINAGIDLTCFMKRDGLNRSQEAALVDVADVCSLFDKTQIGTRSGNVQMTLYRDSVAADDDAWSALPIGTTGFVVIAPFGYTGAGTPPTPQASDRVEVWPIAVSNRSMLAIAANEAQSFTVTFAIPDEPDDDALVAA